MLSEQGHRVGIVHRGTTAADVPADIHYIHGSRDALAELRPEIARFEPAVVLDVIPYSERQARELLKVIADLAERVVAVSSADVYRNYDGLRGKGTAPPDPVPLDEESPLRETLYPYRGHGLPSDWTEDYDKILAERVVMGDQNLPGTVLRLPAVYGPGDKQHRVGAYLDRMDAGDTIVMTEAQAAWRWTRGYVENVAAAIALAVLDSRAAGRVYNVGEESALTEREWVESIGRAAGWTGKVVLAPAEQIREGSRQAFDFRYELAIDTTRIRHVLRYREPIDRDEALRRTVEWERRHRAERPRR